MKHNTLSFIFKEDSNNELLPINQMMEFFVDRMYMADNDAMAYELDREEGECALDDYV